MKTQSKVKKPKKQKSTIHGANGKPECEDIAQFAYYLWEQQGRTHGHDVDDWLEAESQLDEVRSRESAPV